jgi:hypothetical protein
MTDTSPNVGQRYRQMLLARSPVERMMMAARMFDTARAIALASLPPDLSPEESRRRLFERLYGDEIPLHLLPAVLRPR